MTIAARSRGAPQARFKWDVYRGGAWAICDRCSNRVRRSKIYQEWDKLLVCGPCLDPRPPQMSPPDVYPEGIPFTDARPPQDLPDRLTDDSYLAALSGTMTVTVGGYPVYGSGQPTPIGGLSPQNVVENPLPSAANPMVGGSPPFPAYPGQTVFNPAAVIEDDITIRTGPVFPPTVPGAA